MRVTDEQVWVAVCAWRDVYDAQYMYSGSTIGNDEQAMRAALEAALLARTEAGADEADLIQWRYTNVETGEVLTPWTECDAAFREKRKDAPGYQFRELFTHPQDASGDAE